MKYFILLRLSHKTVTVLHYRDDDGTERLQPFKGCDRPIPLAISIINNHITVGQSALEHFEQHLPNCFYKLFALLEGNETYNRFGANHPAQTLIYIAIETILSKLISDEFGHNLDAVRSNLPIGFDFEADVAPEERKKVIDLFKNGYHGECGKYGNVGIIDTNRLIAAAGLIKNFRKYAMVLDSNGNDMSASLYSRENEDCIASRVFPGLGADPGVAKGVNSLKNQILSFDPFIDFSPVEQRLQDIVKKFISSGKPETQGCININNHNYDYFLALCDVKDIGSTHSQNIMTDIRSLGYNSGGININDIVFMVRSANLQTEYFMKIFKGEMDCVKVVDDNLLQSLDSDIITDVIKSGWALDEHIKQKRELDEEYSELKQRIEIVLIPKKNYGLAIRELTDYAEKAHRIDYHEYDEHIRHFISQLQELQKTITTEDPKPVPTPPSPQEPSDDMEGWKKKIRATKEQVIKFVENGMYDDARHEISNLKDDLHDAGIHDFDSEIRVLHTLIPKDQKSPTPTPPQPPKPQTDSPYAEIVVRDGFLGAKHYCTEHDDFDGAVLMGKLDKYHKKYELAANCLNNYVSEGNTNGIKRFADDLKLYVELLKMAKLPSDEAEKLLKQYQYYL